MTDETEVLKAASEATTGPDKPGAAEVRSEIPDLALRMLALAGPALSIMIGWIIVAIAGTGLRVLWIFTIVPRVDWPPAVAEARVQGLMAVALALCGILGVVVFRLASGGLKRVEAKVGPAGITVETGDRRE